MRLIKGNWKEREREQFSRWPAVSLFHKRFITHELWCHLLFFLAARTHANDKRTFCHADRHAKVFITFFWSEHSGFDDQKGPSSTEYEKTVVITKVFFSVESKWDCYASST